MQQGAGVREIKIISILSGCIHPFRKYLSFNDISIL